MFSPVNPMQQHPTRGSIFTNPVQFSCSQATTSHPRLNFYKPCSVQLFPCNNIPPSARFLQTLFSSVCPMQQDSTFGSIFTNPVQSSCPKATTSPPSSNFSNPGSVQSFSCSNIPASSLLLQTLFSSVVPMQQHPAMFELLHVHTCDNGPR